MNKDAWDGLKNRKPVFIILALMGTAFLAVNHYVKNVGAKNDFADKYEFKLLVYPEKYALTMSSSPGIRITAQCYGSVDKVRYSTTFGSLLTWDIPSGKISDRGKDVELPYEMPVYWTPIDGNGLPQTTDKITVKVSILNKNDKLAEKQGDIYYDGSMYFTVQKSPDIKTQETAENLSPPTDRAEAGDTVDHQQFIDWMIAQLKDYPALYPAFVITCGTTKLFWIRGDANFVPDQNVLIGNTNFGADAEVADQALEAAEVAPGAVINLSADEVSGLQAPQFKISEMDIINITASDEGMRDYPSQNGQLTAPGKPGTYLFSCLVSWPGDAHGDTDTITYWFKVQVKSNVSLLNNQQIQLSNLISYKLPDTAGPDCLIQGVQIYGYRKRI